MKIQKEIQLQWHHSKNGNISIDSRNDTNTLGIIAGSHKKAWWLCKKGHEWQACIKNRTLNKTKCPHCFFFKSKGEERINSHLLKNKYNYSREYKIDGCKNKRLLKFDFCIFIKSIRLIEYQGKQHYKSSSFGSHSISPECHLKTIQENDKIKKDFCEQQGLHLLIIPYWEKEIETKIESFLSECEV